MRNQIENFTLKKGDVPNTKWIWVKLLVVSILLNLLILVLSIYLFVYLVRNVGDVLEDENIYPEQTIDQNKLENTIDLFEQRKVE
jgi:hypothetical protein